LKANDGKKSNICLEKQTLFCLLGNKTKFMVKANFKKELLFIVIILLLFVGAGLVFYFAIIYFPDKLDGNNLPITDIEFTDKMSTHLTDLGKFFLTILIGVFVASLTFSEKIVNFNSSSWLAKSLLILCWILLLLSIVCDGVGLVFISNWYANEHVEHSQSNMFMFESAFYSFGFAGVSFGLALTSMLAAGIISFINRLKFKAVESAAPF
jgi:hypothetical protein